MNPTMYKTDIRTEKRNSDILLLEGTHTKPMNGNTVILKWM